jgi:ABC-type nitrate/sulfonate/bicarbonate transport system substrate-binding protein
VLAGSDAVAVTAEFNNPIYSLLAQPGITNFEMLKGKRIGFADSGGTISMSIRKLLAMHGLKDTDYATKMLEGTPARLNCLKRGECDAVALGQPQDVAARTEGFTLLGFSTEATPAYLYTVKAVRRSWAEAHRETLIRYLRALRTSLQFIRDPQHRGDCGRNHFRDHRRFDSGSHQCAGALL